MRASGWSCKVVLRDRRSRTRRLTQRVRGDRKWTAGLSGAKDGGGDAQPGGGAGVAGLVFGVGDLAGDGPELGGNRRLGRVDAFEGVEDLVVLAAARGEHGDDVL